MELFIALAVLAFASDRPHSPQRAAERTAVAVLACSGLFIVLNEGIANWQAMLFSALLLALALTCLRAKAAPG